MKPSGRSGVKGKPYGMRTALLVLYTLVFIGESAQKEIKLEEAKDHISDSVKVIGKIYGIKYIENVMNKPTFINLRSAYPNQLLTIVMWGDVIEKLGYNPQEKKFTQGVAVVTGKIELYKDKPQIVIKDPGQLVFIYHEEVPADQIPPIEKKKDK